MPFLFKKFKGVLLGLRFSDRRLLFFNFKNIWLMRRIYYLIALCLFFSLFANAQVSITSSNNSLGICKENQMVYTLNLSGSNPWPNNLEAQFSINNLNQYPVGCASDLSHISIENLKIFDANNLDVSSVIGISTNSQNGVVYVELDLTNAPSSNVTYTLRFSLFIDCSLIPENPGPNTQIFLNEEWPTVVPLIQYPLTFPYFSNGSGYTQVGPNSLGEITQLFIYGFYSALTTPWSVEFKFVNDGVFSCDPSINVNSAIYEYSTDAQNWTAFIPDQWINISAITAGNSLQIRQRFTVGCVSQCNDLNAHFYWRCAASGSNASSCDHCQKEYVENYAITDSRLSQFEIERICPYENVDVSCPATEVSWTYKVTNIGGQVLNDFEIDLSYIQGAPVGNQSSMLTLIDLNSIFIGTYNSGIPFNLPCGQPLPSSNCTDCLVTPGVTNILTNPNGFYNGQMISSYKATVSKLDPGDFFVITFKTLKCGQINQQDEDLMFQHERLYFNKYRLQITAKNGCGDPAVRVISNAHLYQNAQYISKEGEFSYNSGHDMRLGLVFLPTTTDLSVAPGTPPGADGGHADFFVKTNALMPSVYASGGILGQSSYSNSSPVYGVMRVVIECEPGLRITAADLNNVLFRSNDFAEDWPKMTYDVFNASGSPCDSNAYTFYFNLEHFSSYNSFSSFINNARIDFRLTSCCFGGNNPFSGYRVRFYLLPNKPSCYSLNFPSLCCGSDPQCDGSCSNLQNCTNCVWYPLSMVDGGIHVHCPGCKAPGIIVSDYKMKRTSLGLEDANGDRVADGSGIPITPNYSKYSLLNLSSSNFGDMVSDTLLAFFFDGDMGSGGYSYPGNMLSGGNNAVLDVLQLDRSMTNMSLMDLQLVDFTLYVDAPSNDPSAICCECNGYYENANSNFQTLLSFHVSGNNISNYVTRNDYGDDGQYFFTFHANDLINIANCSGQNLFTGFQVQQNYRLVCNYKVCGNFLAPYGSPTMRDSEIRNNMWLSGIAQPSNAFGSVPEKPNTINEVIAIPDDDPSDPNPPPPPYGYLDDNGNLIFNPGFEDRVIFWCETFGGRHFFHSTYAVSQPYITRDMFPSDTNWCTKIFINPTRVLIGSGDTYPFEFKTPQVGNDSLKLDIPEFWKVVKIMYLANGASYGGLNFNSAIQNAVLLNNDDMPVTNTPSNTVPGDTDPYTTSMTNIGVPVLQCLNEVNQNDNIIHKIRDEELSQMIIAYLEPVDCAYHPSPDNLNGFLDLEYSSNFISGCHAPNMIPDSDCELSLNAITSSYYGIPALVHPNPNLSINFTPPTAIAGSNTVCWNFNILNPNPDLLHTVAPFIYLTTPNSGFLGNWSMTFGGAPVNYNNEIFMIDTLYPITNGVTNPLYSGTLCAEFTGCMSEDSISLPAIFGWNCGGFPSSIDSLDSVCNQNPVSLILKKVPYNANITASGPIYFNTCEDFIVSYTIESIEQGSIYPNLISFGNLPSNLSIVNITANSTDVPGAFYDQGSQGLWDSNVGTMIELHQNQSITINAIFSPGCGFDGNVPELIATCFNYCNASFDLHGQIPQLTFNADLCTPPCTICDHSFTIGQLSACCYQFVDSNPDSTVCQQYGYSIYDASGTLIASYPNVSNFEHCFNQNGVYTICYDYCCANGTSKDTCQTITVTGCETFTCDDFDLKVTNDGCNYTFSAVLPPNFNGTNISYCWNMGYNGQMFCPGAQTINFTYPNGAYHVCYKIAYFDPITNQMVSCKICKDIEVNCSKTDEFCYVIARDSTRDEGKVIIPLRSEGYLVGGEMAGANNMDMYFAHVKDDFTSDYHYLLDESIGGLPDLATVYSTLEVYPNVYILGKTTTATSQNADLVLVCLNQLTHNILWAKRYGTPGMDIGSKILKLNDSYLLITGHTNYYNHDDQNFDLFAMSLNLNGVLQDVAVYKPKGKDRYEISTDAAIIPNSHNQFIIVGYNINSNGNRDMIALKVNPNFTPASNMAIVGELESDEWANGIAIQGAYFYMAGASGSLKNQEYHLYVAEMKTSDCSQTNASRLYVPAYKASVANKILYTNNTLLVAGDLFEQTANLNMNHGTVLKLNCLPNKNKNLEVLWAVKTLKDQDVRFNHLSLFKDNNLLVTGTNNWYKKQPDIFVVNLNLKDGKGCCIEPLLYEKKLFAKYYSDGTSIQRPPFETKPYGKESKYFKLIQICEENSAIVTTTSPIATKNQRSGFDIFPNPNPGFFTIKMSKPENTIKSIAIFDMAGRMLFTRKYPDGKFAASVQDIRANELSGGVYLVQVEALFGKETKLVSISK